MSVRQEGIGDTQKRYLYYACKGKYEYEEDGEKRHICTGHIFTLKTRLPDGCPVCGEPLGILHSRMPKEAMTLATEKCFNCKNREKSAAVNDLECVGGKSDKDGKIQQVRGTKTCNGCLCTECCKEIYDDFNIDMKYGLHKTMPAMVKINDLAERIIRHGCVDLEAKQLVKELRAGDQILKDIPDKIFIRWVYDAIKKTEKESKRFPDRRTTRATTGNLYRPLEKVMSQLTPASKMK
jgi:hypothetical protein